MDTSQLLTSLESEKSTLMEVYENSRNDSPSATEDLVSIYQEFFVSNAPHAKDQAPAFEKVSLIDPTIKTILQSTTAS